MKVRFLGRALIVLVVLCASGFLVLTYWRTAPGNGVADRAEMAGAGEESLQADALGQFSPLPAPRPAPGVDFSASDGRPASLADFRGRWVLVNLWATWCGPCVREMPSLDRLQARFGGRLTVVAISEDRSGAQVVDPFRQKLGLTNLALYLDPKANAQRAFAVRGLPTSFLIDPQGRILGRLEGAADWDAPDIVARLNSYLRQDEAAGPIKTASPQ